MPDKNFSTNKSVLSFNFGDGKDSPNNNLINMTDRELDKICYTQTSSIMIIMHFLS